MDFLIKESPFLFSLIFLMILVINLSHLFAHEYKNSFVILSICTLFWQS